MDFGCLHTGECQAEGRCSNGVRGGMTFFGSPMAGSYIQPHFAHFIFFMTVFRKWLILNSLMFNRWGKMTTNQWLNT